MSKHNKVNKSNYDQGGRLTPDEMARERDKMRNDAKVRDGAKTPLEVIGRAPAAARPDRAGQGSTPRQSEREESE